MKTKGGIIETAMKYRQIVILIVSLMFFLGIYALIKMPKQEFPVFTVRQGVVIAVYPGATSDEVEEQVTKPLEDFIVRQKRPDEWRVEEKPFEAREGREQDNESY